MLKSKVFLRNPGQFLRGNFLFVIFRTFLNSRTILDVMLRDQEKNVRFEEIPVAKRFAGRPLSELKLWRYNNTILVGLKTKTSWIYKPAEGYMLEPGNALVIITNPEDRQALEELMR